MKHFGAVIGLSPRPNSACYAHTCMFISTEMCMHGDKHDPRGVQEQSSLREEQNGLLRNKKQRHPQLSELDTDTQA
jgi:hypothetical protein